MKKSTFLGLVATTLLTVSLSGCGLLGGSSASTEVKTSRITKKTVGAIQAEDTNVISLYGGEIKLPEGFRYSKVEDEKTLVTTYFAFNPDISNAIADKKDGRSGDDYENALREAWETAKTLAEQQAKKKFGKKDPTPTEPLEDDVFVFDTTAYTTAYNENNYLIVYEGIDNNTPAEELTDAQIKLSLRTYLQNTLGANVELRNALWDTNSLPYANELNAGLHPELADPNLNGKYYAISFYAYSGNYETTTYGIQCYPFTYYGVAFMEREKFDGSFRRWYAVVFVNNSEGEVFSEADYNFVFSQLRTSFGIHRYFTIFEDTDNFAYKPEEDTRYGRSYEQLLSIFDATKQYYVIKANKTTPPTTESADPTAEPTGNDETPAEDDASVTTLDMSDMISHGENNTDD